VYASQDAILFCVFRRRKPRRAVVKNVEFMAFRCRLLFVCLLLMLSPRTAAFKIFIVDRPKFLL
jgi:hypothetical protein